MLSAIPLRPLGYAALWLIGLTLVSSLLAGHWVSVPVLFVGVFLGLSWAALALVARHENRKARTR